MSNGETNIVDDQRDPYRITIDEFARNGPAILKRAEHHAITVVGDDGKTRMVICCQRYDPDEDD